MMTPGKECECVARVNRKLEPKGVVLKVGAFLLKGRMRVRPILAVTKPDGTSAGRKIVNVVGHYCAFCGKRYPEISP